MRIPCPFCGSRDAQEFVYRGDADPLRPAMDSGAEEDLFEYLYERANPAGLLREHWYHAQGCRNWLVVTRDTTTHAISAAIFARDAAS
jgi:heterotetrameric sarcosine oxidase delta subunit